MKSDYLPFILALDDASATLETVGGKGASLARMAAAGLPVPPGFHITTAAYRRFVEANELQGAILAAISKVKVNDPATLEEAARQISSLFSQSAVPDEIARAISTAYAALGRDDLPVAVRSSATAEDLPELSFAGQQETYLNMSSASMVLDAVKRCWASLWTARAIGYRTLHHISQDEVSLAVVVQELIPADAAGILFTANPLTGARDQVMINAAWGLGEAIVGGQVTPDTVVVDKASGAITQQEISEKDVMTVPTQSGTREEAVPADRRARAVLNPAQVTSLARIGVQIESLYGQPMDIEWTLRDGHLSVVQARPITALPAASVTTQVPQAAEWNLPNPKGQYYRTSVIELLPDPLSPLFATLGLPAWGRATKETLGGVGLGSMFPGEALITINGYGYYNVTLTPADTAKVLLVTPRILSIFLSLLNSSEQRWQKTRSKYAATADYWQTKDLETTPATNLLGGVRAITDEAAEYYLSVQAGILPEAYMSEALFALLYNRFLKRHNDPPALTFVLGFDSAPIQAEKSLYALARWVREQPELAAALMNMSSEQFTSAYREQAIQAETVGAWPEFWRRLSEHLTHFGHAIYDLDFAKTLLIDDPGQVLETLKFFLSDEATDPNIRQAEAEAAREQATKALLNRRRGLTLKLFRPLVETAQRFAPLREDALADAGLGWPILRRMLHEIGRRLVSGNAIDTSDDVFWLTLNELQDATTTLDAGHQLSDYHTIITERHATWEREHELTPPVALPIKGGARFLGIDLSSVMPARVEQSDNVLKGIAASPGRVTGLARVIHGPEEFEYMRPGEILVAKITTPAWTPLFVLASGVVTDVGGPLSHSSIVAREYHIPAVLGTGVATERLHSGQRIIVDGNAGTVKSAE